jgi:6-pyruvoyltetrahydropterin/6-carboxytetrahydropterin synthase
MHILHKQFQFCAAHKYYNPSFTDSENWMAFGKDIQLHGHNYTLTISVTGEINPDTGFLVDLGHLKDVVKNNVIDVLDHRHIEVDIPWFKGKQPSTENMVTWIWEAIEKDFDGTLWRVRLQETPSIFTDYYGKNQP